MARTDYHVVFNATPGQGRAIVGADVFNCVKPAINIEHRYLHIIHDHDFVCARRQFNQWANLAPVHGPGFFMKDPEFA